MGIKYYFIAKLLNIKDENITFDEGIHHENIKGIAYTVISAKLYYYKYFCHSCHGNDIIKYGFKASNVKCQSSAAYLILLNLIKQKMYCKVCGRYFLASSNIVDKYSYIYINVKKSMSFIYCDFSNGKVVDVLENGQLPFLNRFLSNYQKKLRDMVKTISIDLYAPYLSFIKIYLLI